MITSKIFFSLRLWVCELHMHVHVCGHTWVCIKVCVCAKGWCCMSFSIVLHFICWVMASHWPQSPLNWMVYLGILSQGCLVSAYQTCDLQVGHHINLAFAQVMEIWSQILKLTQASACPLNHFAVCGNSYDLFHPNAPVLLWYAMKYYFISLVDEEIKPQTEVIYIW